MKTIIDEIQARDKYESTHRGLGNTLTLDGMARTYGAVCNDRTTLLSILAEIRVLPDRWCNGTIGSPFGLEGIAGMKQGIDGCADDLKAILNRTKQQGGD